MKYTVTQFGVDEKFNEVDEPIWEGEANDETDAIDKALWQNWTDKEMREFMRLYLKAVPFESN